MGDGCETPHPHPPAPTSVTVRSRGACVPPPIPAGLWGAWAGLCPGWGGPLPQFLTPQGSSAASQWLSAPVVAGPPPRQPALCGDNADVPSLSLQLLLFWGVLDVVTEGVSATSAPGQPVAQCPCVLQGCPQACPAPPSRRTFSPWPFLSPLCPHRSHSSLSPTSAESIHLPWVDTAKSIHLPWVPPMGARPGPGLCPAAARDPKSSLSPACPQGCGGTTRERGQGWGGLFAPSC